MAFDVSRGRVIAFGGSGDRHGGSPDGVMWEWDGTAWSSRGSGGVFRVAPAMAYDEARSVAVVFGGYEPGTVYGETFEWDGAEWTLRPEPGPSARYRSAMAYDAARGVTVLFGGFGSRLPPNYQPLADTWEWDGKTWSERQIAGPSARGAHGMVYDSKRSRVVLYGGSPVPYKGRVLPTDTWEYDGTAWTRRAEGGPPPAAWGAMTFDSERGVSVLAPSSWDDGVRAEIWEWDGETWSERLVEGPVSRYGHAIAFDPERGRTVLFGGFRYTSMLSDTWELDENGWSQRMHTRPQHADLYNVTSFLDDVEGGFIARTPAGVSPEGEFEIMWRFDGTGWNVLPVREPRSSLGNRLVYFTGAYDTDRGVHVFHGGFNGLGYEGVTWEYDGVSATERTRDGPYGYALEMIYDPDRGVCVALGFNRSVTWEWDGRAWTSRANSPAPPRHGVLAYDSERRVCVLVTGGWPEPNIPSQTWEYDGVNWAMRAETAPTLTATASLAYSARTRMTILHTADVTWGWDGGEWRELVTATPRLTRLTTDAETGTVVAIDVSTFGLYRLELETADWNGDSGVNSQDLFDFVVAFFGGEADFNGDGETTSADFFEFLGVFLGGCV